MSWLVNMLFFPVTIPAKGLLFVFEQIKEQVNAEQLDEGLVEDQLITLSLLHDLGEISDDDHFAQEGALLERLNAIHAYKESLMQPERIAEPAPVPEPRIPAGAGTHE